MLGLLLRLLLRPDEALHGREIARRTGLPAFKGLAAKGPAAAQRKLSDHSGDPLHAAECPASALELLAHLRTWLQAHRPDLL